MSREMDIVEAKLRHSLGRAAQHMDTALCGTNNNIDQSGPLA